MMVKSDRKTQTAVGAVVLIFIVWLILDSQSPKRRWQPPPPAQQKTLRIRPGEEADDIVLRFQSEMKRLAADNEKQKREILDQRHLLEEYEERTAEILKKMLQRVNEATELAHDASRKTGRGGPGASAPATTIGSELGQYVEPIGAVNQPSSQDANVPDEVNELKLEKIFDGPVAEVAPAPKKKINKVAFIGAGDSVKVRLLAGVNAPTNGRPYPVILELASDVYGPDGSVLPLGKARVVAAAQGSLADSRALFRLTTMNLRLPTGERKILRIDGWVVGEDGIRGLPGILVDPLGKVLFGVGAVGTVQGLGFGLQQANQTILANTQTSTLTQIVDGNQTEFALGTGLANASQVWQQLVQQRLQGIVPVVQVLSGREATAIFAQNVSIPGLFEAMEWENEEGAIQLVSLD